MATTTRNTADAQAQILDAVRQSQAAAVDGLRSWAETVQQFVPAQKSWPQAADQLSTPGEVVDSVFDFAAELLTAQREFAHSVLSVTAPIVERSRQEAEKPAQQAQKTAKDA